MSPRTTPVPSRSRISSDSAISTPTPPYNESSFDFPGVYVTRIAQQHQWSDEFQVTGTGFDERAKWITGAFYSKQLTDVYEQVDAFGAADPPGHE